MPGQRGVHGSDGGRGDRAEVPVQADDGVAGRRGQGAGGGLRGQPAVAQTA